MGNLIFTAALYTIVKIWKQPKCPFFLKCPHKNGQSCCDVYVQWNIVVHCPVAKSCLTICDPMDCNMPGFSVLLPGACSNSCSLIQWHHSTISSSAASFSSALNLSQHQGLFQWVGSPYQVCISQSIGASASVLPINIQDLFPLGLTSLISLLSKGLSRIFSNTTVQKHQFFSVQTSLWSNSHICTWLLEKPQLRLYGPLLEKWRLCFLILQWNITQLQKRMKFCLLQQYE